MLTAVAYVRMSSDKQEASPKQQREEITKLAKRKANWPIALRLTGESVDRADGQVDTHVTQPRANWPPPLNSLLRSTARQISVSRDGPTTPLLVPRRDLVRLKKDTCSRQPSCNALNPPRLGHLHVWQSNSADCGQQDFQRTIKLKR